MEINRKRQRKDTLYVSKRHLRRLAAQEADIVSQNLFNTTLLSCKNGKLTTDLDNDGINDRINSKIIDIDNDIVCENNAGFEQHIHENANIFVQYENVNRQSESDLERSSLYVSRDELSELPVESENKSEFEDDLAVWAVKH